MGKVLPLGGIQKKGRTAYDAGIKEVILPADNLEEARILPAYITEGLKLTGVRSLPKVLAASLCGQ